VGGRCGAFARLRARRVALKLRRRLPGRCLVSRCEPGCLRARTCADGRGLNSGLVLLLSLATSTDSFQLQGALMGLGSAQARPRQLCSQAAPSPWLSHGAFGRASGGLRGNEAATALEAGAADFILDSFDPEEEEDELSNENLLKIVYSETTDQHVNDLVWNALGEKAGVNRGAKRESSLAHSGCVICKEMQATGKVGERIARCAK
jgi:hypothetical protein